MNKLHYLWCVSLLEILTLTSAAIAETEAVAELTPVFSPRLGARYTTEGGGFESLTSVEGFVPLFQNPGNNLTFLEGKFSLDSDSNVSTNVLLGHRLFSKDANRVTGGYISYSTRDTDRSYFDQLGLGFETLGNFDFRFNAYLPLGKSSEEISQVFTGTTFQGNSLLIGRRRLYEVALSGIDAEFGTRLISLGSGDLRGFAGAYFYSGGESLEAFGWRTRLEARPTDYLNLGLSLQHDRLFDTRLVFTIGASFPGSGSRSNRKNTDSAVFRLAESGYRQPTILVTDEVRNDSLVATDPSGQPLNIIYVSNTGSSDGTIESPFRQVSDAVKVAKENDIIYVTSNTTAEFEPFTIPDGVQVLSGAIAQSVNTTEVGAVKLPGSGSGIYPIVTGTMSGGNGIVTLANNSTLSGFDVRVRGGDEARGIKGTEVSNVRILHNKVSNAFGEGIYLENATGNVEISRNQVTDTRNPESDTNLESGIFVWNYKGNANLLVSDNVIATNFDAEDYRVDGIELNLCRDVDEPYVGSTCAGAAKLSATISGNQIFHNGDVSGGADGIDLNLGNLGDGTLTLTNNTLKDIPDEGVSINAVANSTGTFNITNNTISKVGDSAIEVDLFLPDLEISPAVNLFNNSVTKYVISGNTLELTDNDGIDFTVADKANATILIQGNTIRDIGDDSGNDNGIQLEGETETVLRPTIVNNTISNIKIYGISAQSVNDATIENNNITDAIFSGIIVSGTTGNNSVSNNTITAPQGSRTGGAAIELNFANNLQVNGNQIGSFDGLGISLTSTTGTNIVSNNTVANVNLAGIRVADSENVQISDNSIDKVTSGNGIAIEPLRAGSTNISNNTISNIQGDGVNFVAFGDANFTIDIVGNNISNATGLDAADGIEVNFFDNTSSTIDISGNTVSVATGYGINFNNFSVGTINRTVTDNTITNAQNGETNF